MGKEPIVYVIFDDTNKIIVSATTNWKKAEAIRDKEQKIHDINIQILTIYPTEVEDMLKKSYFVEIYPTGFYVNEMSPSELYNYDRETNKYVSDDNSIVVYANDEFEAARKAKAIISEAKKEE